MAARRKTNRRRNPVNWAAFTAGAISALTVAAASLGIYKLVKKPRAPSLGPINGA